MAPGRRKGGNRGKEAGQLRLGDLVLAKVKGFPAWPAKISRPEDWDRSPDPRKYFVQFFGTSKIAFVAPADIQVFTNESKNKLTARCQGKTVKYFARAVEEICEAFEELHKKSSGESGEDDDGTGLVSPSGDTLEDHKQQARHQESSHLEGQEEKFELALSDKNKCSHDELQGTGRCLQSGEMAVSSGLGGSESLVLSDLKRRKGSNSGVQVPKEKKVSGSRSTSGTSSNKKENLASFKHDDGERNHGMMCTTPEVGDFLPKGSAKDQEDDHVDLLSH